MSDNSGEAAVKVIGGLIFLAFAIPTCIYQQNNAHNAEKKAAEELGQIEEVPETVLYRVGTYKEHDTFTIDMRIPTELYKCYLEGNILDPGAVAKACGNNLSEDEINDDTVLGRYKFYPPAAFHSAVELRKITPAILPELKKLIEERLVRPVPLSYNQAPSWLHRVEWVRATDAARATERA